MMPSFYDMVGCFYGLQLIEIVERVEHALSCPKSGFPSIRHNEVRDLTATLLSEVCHNVSFEPGLQPL